MVINGDANGTPAPASLTPATGSASGSASASGGLAATSLTAATGTASGGATASGTPSPVSLTAATGSASGGVSVTGNASGTLASISLTEATGAASGTAGGRAHGGPVHRPFYFYNSDDEKKAAELAAQVSQPAAKPDGEAAPKAAVIATDAPLASLTSVIRTAFKPSASVPPVIDPALAVFLAEQQALIAQAIADELEEEEIAIAMMMA